MGMDIYAGTFTRYYARNWKTATQKFCEENGIKYSMTRAPENEVPEGQEVPPDEIEKDVAEWQEYMVSALKKVGIEAAETWKDDNVKPYYTEKPDWDAFGALLIYASAKLLGKKVPEEFPKNMDFCNHELFKKAMDKECADWSMFAGVCHWIPIKDNFMFNYVLANGKEASIGTVAGLRYELEQINRAGWNVDEKTILSWFTTEGYPTDAELKNGKYTINKTRDVYDTESLAKFAFSILWQAVSFSEKECVPIIMDY